MTGSCANVAAPKPQSHRAVYNQSKVNGTFKDV